MLMAEGRSNAGIARRLWVTEGTVEKNVRSILTKLNLTETSDDHSLVPEERQAHPHRLPARPSSESRKSG